MRKRYVLAQVVFVLTLGAWVDAQRSSRSPVCATSQPRVARDVAQAAEPTVRAGEDASPSRPLFPGPFQRPSSFSAEAASADLNGDGILDVVAAGFEVTAFVASPGGRFRRAWTSKPFNAAEAIALGDLDGDGTIDIASTTRFGVLSTYLGQGDGTFVGGATTAAQEGYQLELTDLDGDGRLDAVTAGLSSTSLVHTLLGQGDGTFVHVGSFAPPSRPETLALGDVNGDGFSDVLSSDSSASDLSLRLGKGDGTFHAPTTVVIGPTFPAGASHTPTLVDVNDDGKLDLLCSNLTSLVVRRGLGTGAFGPQIWSEVNASPAWITMADANGDGALDAVFWTGLSQKTVVIARGDGTGKFTPVQTIGAEHDARPPLVGEWSADDALDLLFATDGITRYLGRRNGRFAAPDSWKVGSDPRDLSVGDLDGNGTLDLLVPNYGSKDLTVLLGQAVGGFQQVKPPQVANRAIQTSLADLDGDGILDLLLTRDVAPELVPRLGRGDGTFAAGAAVTTGGFATAPGDLDNDGAVDVVALRDAGVFVLLGVGDGSFQPDATYAMGAGARDVVLADFDLDGVLDIATTSITEAAVSVRLGIGDGTFGPEARYPVGTSPIALVAADMNGDAVLDLAVQLSVNPVSVLRGRGDGSFGGARTQPFAGFSGPVDLAVADVDLDAQPDLLSLSTNASALLVSLGGGEGDVAEPIGFHAGDRPTRLAASDFDGDGAPDVIILSQTKLLLLARE